jgi:hypothetical protein
MRQWQARGRRRATAEQVKRHRGLPKPVFALEPGQKGAFSQLAVGRVIREVLGPLALFGAAQPLGEDRHQAAPALVLHRPVGILNVGVGKTVLMRRQIEMPGGAHQVFFEVLSGGLIDLAQQVASGGVFFRRDQLEHVARGRRAVFVALHPNTADRTFDITANAVQVAVFIGDAFFPMRKRVFVQTIGVFAVAGDGDRRDQRRLGATDDLVGVFAATPTLEVIERALFRATANDALFAARKLSVDPIVDQRHVLAVGAVGVAVIGVHALGVLFGKAQSHLLGPRRPLLFFGHRVEQRRRGCCSQLEPVFASRIFQAGPMARILFPQRLQLGEPRFAQKDPRARRVGIELAALFAATRSRHAEVRRRAASAARVFGKTAPGAGDTPLVRRVFAVFRCW